MFEQYLTSQFADDARSQKPKDCEMAGSSNFTCYSGTKLCLSQEPAAFDNKELYSHINYARIRQDRQMYVPYKRSVEPPSRKQLLP